jgi:hypothetical protein
MYEIESRLQYFHEIGPAKSLSSTWPVIFAFLVNFCLKFYPVFTLFSKSAGYYFHSLSVIESAVSYFISVYYTF